MMKKYLFWLAYGVVLNGLMPDEGSAQSVAPAAQPSSTGEAPAEELQEVIVTANRRSENLQAVPMTVSVVTADTLANEGITDTASIQNAVPGLVIGNVAGFSEPFIRGIGTTATSAGSEASVATYVDGVYIASETAALFNLNNIAQVEVLKGPQGTLFGRNATGGVIQILTKDPTQQTKVDASVGYSNYQTYEGSLYATTGIAPDLAADVAVYATKQDDGWGHYATGQDAYTGDDVSVRSKWLWTPAAGTRVTLSGDYSRNVSQEGLAFSIYPGAIGSTGQRSGGFYDPSGSDSYGKDVQEGGSLKLEQDLGWARIVNIAAYRHADFHAPFDYDAQLAPLEYATFSLPSRTTSEELQLASVDSSTIKWIVGTIYFSSHSSDDPLQLQLPFVTIRAFAPQTDKSYAVYAQTTIPLPGDNNLTLGGRYSIDQIGINGFASINGSPPLDAAAQSERYGKPTWRFAFDHEFTTDLRGYVSYNRGVKSGLYNEDTYFAPPVKPEELDAYEAGFKTEVLDHRLKLNASSFFYNWRNIQVVEFSGASQYYVNAAAAHIYGVDLDLATAPFHDITLSGGLSWAHGRYTSFPDAPANVPAPGGGNVSTTIDATGNETVHTPEYSANIVANYALQLSRATLDFNASYSYNSSYYWEPDNRLSQPAVNLVNVAAIWRPTNASWDVKLWGKNLLGEKYYVAAQSTPFADEGSAAPPLTYGITFGVHYR
jgi:iron complex outermembrane receptor protein